MKKRLIALLLVFVLAMLPACSKSANPSGGNGDVTQAPKDDNAGKSDPTSIVTEDPTSAPTGEPAEAPAAGGDGPEDSTEDNGYDVDALGNTPDVYTFNYGVAESYIRDVTDYGDHLVVTFDAMYQILMHIEDLADVKVGDTIYVMDKPVVVTDILTLDDDYNYTVEHESVEEAGLYARVICLPENLADFYTAEQIEYNGFDENPEYASFGFVFSDDAYYAFTDWTWDDCYVPMTYCAMYGAKLVVTENTKVSSCYYDMDTYGFDFTMTGTEYFKLREDETAQEERKIWIHDDTGYRIYLKYEDGSYTGEIDELNEIYMP